MKIVNASLSALISAAVILSAGTGGCGKKTAEWGNALEYKNSKLHYTDAVTKAEARQLGDYLSEAGFFQEENPGSVQLHKEEDAYHFRMVVKEDVEGNEDFISACGLFSAQLSRDVFNDFPVIVHLCDRQFNTIHTATFSYEETAEDQAVAGEEAKKEE